MRQLQLRSYLRDIIKQLKSSKFLRVMVSNPSSHPTEANPIFKKQKSNTRFFLMILINSKIAQFSMVRKQISEINRSQWVKFLLGVNMIHQLKMISQITSVPFRKNTRSTKWVLNSLLKSKIISETLKINSIKLKKNRL